MFPYSIVEQDHLFSIMKVIMWMKRVFVRICFQPEAPWDFLGHAGICLKFFYTRVFVRLPLYQTRIVWYHFPLVYSLSLCPFSKSITQSASNCSGFHPVSASNNMDSSFLDLRLIISIPGRFQGYARWFRWLGHDLMNSTANNWSHNIFQRWIHGC